MHPNYTKHRLKKEDSIMLRFNLLRSSMNQELFESTSVIRVTIIINMDDF